MDRREAITESLIVDNVFNFEKFRKLKLMFRFSSASPVRRPRNVVNSPKAQTKFLSDRERVAQVQKSKNNYRDAKPTK